MILSIKINSQTYEINADDPFDISIPLDFYGAQPNAYGVEKAESKPCEAEGIVGDTRRGGSCNFEQVKFIPHCNGTHTESVGHLTHTRISIRDCLQEAFILAALISVEPERSNETSETYSINLNENDKLITRTAIENALKNSELEIPDFKSLKSSKALIVRVLPNDERKLSQTYLENVPPFFSTDAMRLIRDLNIKHLLVDLPSIDRIFDEGKLSNHRIFWNIREGSFETDAQTLVNNTITELIYVSNEIADGNYLLNLQIAPFAADAAPSRPLIFKILE